MSDKKQTYGGLSVSDEYLSRYGVSSDQEVCRGIAVSLTIVASVLVFALLVLVVWVT